MNKEHEKEESDSKIKKKMKNDIKKKSKIILRKNQKDSEIDSIIIFQDNENIYSSDLSKGINFTDSKILNKQISLIVNQFKNCEKKYENKEINNSISNSVFVKY